MTMTLASLLGGLAPGVLDTGTLISPGEARRLAAEHGLIPVVLGTKSEVLDVGSKARFHTQAMRIGLRVQHRTCTVQGCTVPAAWCHAHHKTPWALSRRTSLADGTLVCGPHHRKIHHPAYTTTYDPGGTTHLTRTRR
ncbi:HNH endonuclease signature motif containing protein [Nocardioides marmoribigeumensis]|uniref:HNH endonuclease signature motif containing protein n=1 Tax=Nocardioides marmoribigeumensis TaxID=433649 RepID=UPI00286D370D|nr:HNH endonuclease signature motif containing protein [Nocardioides marmoribigeumensis]